MANRYSKKKKPVNKTKEWITDYYQTGREWDKDNKRRREEAGEKENKGLKNLNSFERSCIVIIILALIGLFIKLVVLKHGFWTPGI
ncbi:MAG: hypothetical protein Q4A65_04385 [Bacillota bacterium]|nr:hypothetical protein [Bacillota bacterium]